MGGLKWRDSIRVTESVLTITEIWPRQDPNFFSTLKLILFAASCIIFNITLIEELRNLLIKQDYDALAAHLSTFGLYIGYSIKIIIFKMKKPQLSLMLESLTSFEELTSEIPTLKLKSIKTSNQISIFYITCVGLSILLYLFKPLYSEYNLPVTWSYNLNSIQYYGLLILQCFCCYYLVMIGISFDLIIIGLINVAYAQLEILRLNIKDFQNKNISRVIELKFWKQCIQHHQKILRFVNQTEDVFTYIFLVQCLSSVTSICNGLFQLVHTGNLLSVQFYFNCAFSFDVLFEIGICCWFATLLTIKSVEVAEACFNYDWIFSNSEIKRMIIFMIRRSQKPLFLTAGKIIPLSMGSYLQVLKTAYSYFALMQSLYDRNH